MHQQNKMVHKIQTEEELQVTSHLQCHTQRVSAVTRVDTIKCMFYPGGQANALSVGHLLSGLSPPAMGILIRSWLTVPRSNTEGSEHPLKNTDAPCATPQRPEQGRDNYQCYAPASGGMHDRR